MSLSSISGVTNHLDRTFDCKVGGDMEFEVGRTLNVDLSKIKIQLFITCTSISNRVFAVFDRLTSTCGVFNVNNSTPVA